MTPGHKVLSVLLIEVFLCSNTLPAGANVSSQAYRSTLRPSTTFKTSKDGSDKTLQNLQHELGTQTLPRFLTSTLLKDPRQTIVAGNKRITYQDLEDQSNRFANALLTLGIQKGERVSTMLPNSAEYLIAMSGIPKTGAVWITLKTQYKSEEMKRELQETEAKAIVIFEDYLPYLEEIHSTLLHLSSVILVTRQDLGMTPASPRKRKIEVVKMYDLLRTASPQLPEIEIHPKDLAAIAYTSGVTGRTKGVVLTHQSVLAIVEQNATWLREAGDGPVASLVPITPTYGGNVILAALEQGRPLLLFPRSEDEANFYKGVVAGLEKEKIAVLFGVPASLLQLATTLQQEKKTLPTLQVALGRGSRLPVETQEALKAVIPGIHVIEGGGLTETSSYVTNPVIANKVGTVGLPNPGVEIKIVNPETLQSLSPGEIGEILIRAPQKMEGYWNDPEATAKVLLPDGWVRSGDLGFVDEEGYLTYQGRRKEIIITGGFNVTPADVEEVLQQHSAIREAVVAGVSDLDWFDKTDTEGRNLVQRFGEVVVAFVVLKENMTATSQEIIQWTKPKLADYKVPKRILFVDHIPRVGSYDKVDRIALIERYAAKDGGRHHGVFIEKDPRGFATLTVNRPGIFPTNALSKETFEALEEAIDAANQDESVKIMILTGGGGHFIGGGDLKYALKNIDSKESLMEYFQLGERLSLKMLKSKKPIIAAISGEAVGGGAQLALATHYRIGAPDAYFRMPEVRRLDIVPGFGGTQIIPRLLGIRKAFELMLTGEKVTEGLFDEIASDPVAQAEEIALAFAMGYRLLEGKVREKLTKRIPEAISTSQRDEWKAVFKRDGTIRQDEANARLLEILEARRKEGHEKAALAEIKAVSLGFVEPLEKGLQHEAELAAKQMQTEEARRSLEARLKEAEKPWLALYPEGISQSPSYPGIPIHEFIMNALQKHADQKIHLLSGRKGDPEGRTIRYGDLEEPINRFAHALHELGIRKGDRVALMLPDSFQHIVAFPASLEIGAIPTLIDTLSSPAELKNQLILTKPKAIVLLEEFYPLLTEIREEVPFLQTVILTSRSDFMAPSEEIPEDTEEVKHFVNLLKAYSPEVPKVEVQPDDTAVLLFTGGITGVPKATELSHRNLVSATLQRASWIFQKDDPTKEIFMADLPYYHVYGLHAGFLLGLSQGTEMVVLPHVPKEHADAMAEALSHHKVTYLAGLPTTFDRIIDQVNKRSLPLHLKVAISSGARLDEKTREAFYTLTEASLRQGLGQTEAPLILHEVMEGEPVEGSVGIPMPDTEIMIVDPEVKEELIPVHAGEAGELVVRGPQVFKGYWENPEETAKVKTKEGWLRTGDLARIGRDGRVYLLARKKNMIKVSGNQVFPREVEKVLAKHPKVAEVAVVGIPDETTGERIVAFIRPQEERSITDKEIQGFAQGKLSVFKIPATIRFVSEPLPRLGTFDQIDYEKLRIRAFRRHLVESVQERKWAWAIRQLEESPLAKGKEKDLCAFCFGELKEAYDISTQLEKRLPIRLFLWSLIQNGDLVGSELKETIEKQLAYWLFRDDPRSFFREPIPSLASELKRLQDEQSGDELFEAAWERIRETYLALTPPDIFKISRETSRPKASDISKSFLFTDLFELKDRDNPYDITKNQRYVPTLAEVQQIVYELQSLMSEEERAKFSDFALAKEAIEYLRALHDAHYDDKSVFAGIAYFVDPYNPEKKTPVMIVSLQKGSTIQEIIARNKGYTMPWGYWKYVRAIRLAEMFRLPVISLVDVTGAWNGLSGAIEDTSGAVSYAIQLGAEKTVPGMVIVTGEGGSAGGLAATMDKTLMLSNSTRFVATPRGQFAILNLSKKVALLILDELKQEKLQSIFEIDEVGQEVLLRGVQGRVEKAEPGSLHANFLIKTILEVAPQVGGKTPEPEAFEPFKAHVSALWKKFEDDLLDRITVATQADPESGLALGAIGGILDEPLGGAHRFQDGTYLAIGKAISSFLSHIQNLSTEEVIQERYQHFREMGSIPGKDYVVKDYSLERKKASGKDLERGRLGIQDWLEKLVDQGEKGGLLIEEINPNLADLDEGPIDFYRKLDLPDVFPLDTYQKSLEKAREVTGSWSGVFTGYATIGGKEVMLMIKDPRFVGASDKSGLVGEKITLAIEEVIGRYQKEKKDIPIVFINTASGARQQDGPRSIDPLNKNNAALSLAKELGIPFINVDTVYMYGGDSASTSSYQDAAMLLATKGTQKGFTGPRPTASVEGRNLPSLYFSAEFLVKRGFLDGVIEVGQLRDLFIAYFDSESSVPSAQAMRPTLHQILERRDKRVARVRKKEWEGFPALTHHADWQARRRHFLGRLQDQQAGSQKKHWTAEHVDTEKIIYIPGGHYTWQRITFPPVHEINRPPFLAQAHAALAIEYLVQRNTGKAKEHLFEVTRLATGEEKISSQLENAYKTFETSGGTPDPLIEARIDQIKQRENAFAKDSGNKGGGTLYEKALERLRDGGVDEAIHAFAKYLNQDNDAYLFLSWAYLNPKDKGGEEKERLFRELIALGKKPFEGSLTPGQRERLLPILLAFAAFKPVTEQEEIPPGAEVLSLSGYQGVELTGYFFKAKGFEAKEKFPTVIMLPAQGISVLALHRYGYVGLLQERYPVNVLLLEPRHHGESKGLFSSWGHLESLDLKAVVDNLKEFKYKPLKIDVDHLIGYGFSNGTLAWMLAANQGMPISALILDTLPAMREEKEGVSWKIGWSTLFPESLTEYADSTMREMKFILDQHLNRSTKRNIPKIEEKDLLYDPLKALSDLKVPSLVVVETKDKWTPPERQRQIYWRVSDMKNPAIQSVSIAGRHGMGYRDSPDAYKGAIYRFLDPLLKEDHLAQVTHPSESERGTSRIFHLKRGGGYVEIVPELKLSAELVEVKKDNLHTILKFQTNGGPIPVDWLSVYRKRLEKNDWAISSSHQKEMGHLEREFHPRGVLVVNQGAYYLRIGNLSVRNQAAEVEVIRGTWHGAVPKAVLVPFAKDRSPKTFLLSKSTSHFTKVAPAVEVRLVNIDTESKMPVKLSLKIPRQTTLTWLSVHLRRLKEGDWTGRPPYNEAGSLTVLRDFNLDSVLVLNDGDYYLRILEPSVENQVVKVEVTEGLRRGLVPEELLSKAKDGADREIARQAAITRGEVRIRKLKETKEAKEFKDEGRWVYPVPEDLSDPKKFTKDDLILFPILEEIYLEFGRLYATQLKEEGDPQNFPVTTGMFILSQDKRHVRDDYAMAEGVYEGKKVEIPYSIAYQEGLLNIIALLEEAERLVEDSDTKEYLRANIEAALWNKWEARDHVWMKILTQAREQNRAPFGGSRLRYYFGPYEAVIGTRGAFQATIGIMDPVLSEEASKVDSYLPWYLEKHGFPVKGRETTMHTFVIYTPFNAGMRFSAQQLPNYASARKAWGQVIHHSASAINAKFEEMGWPIAQKILDPSQQKYVSVQSTLRRIMLHEFSHATIVLSQEERAMRRKMLNESETNYFYIMNELNADLSFYKGLEQFRELFPDPEDRRGVLARIFIDPFVSLYEAISEKNETFRWYLSGRTAALLYLIKERLIRFDEENGTYRLVFETESELSHFEEALKHFAEEILPVFLKGDIKEVEQRVGDSRRYEVFRPVFDKILDSQKLTEEQRKEYWRRFEHLVKHGSLKTYVEPQGVKDGGRHQWDPSVVEEFALQWAIKPGKEKEPVLVKPTPLLVTTEMAIDMEAQRAAALAIADIFRVNPAGSRILVRHSLHSPFSIETLAQQATILAIDASILEHQTTRREFKIILSLLAEVGRFTPIWIVETNMKGSHRRILRSFTQLGYPFIRVMTLEEYREELKFLGSPILKIAYEENEIEMEIGDRDKNIVLSRPEDGRIVSGFSLMSLALGKDLVLGQMEAQIKDMLDEIKSAIVIPADEDYRLAVDTIYNL